MGAVAWVMSPYHATSHVVGHVIMGAWCISEFEYSDNRVEPRCNTLEFFAFSSAVQFQSFQLPFVLRIIICFTAPSLVKNTCSSLVEY